jgi:hypothetical protein
MMSTGNIGAARPNPPEIDDETMIVIVPDTKALKNQSPHLRCDFN